MISKLSMYGNCPKCKKSWDSGRIKDVWRSMKEYDEYSDKDLIKMEKESYSKPYRFSKLIGVEIREKYDGVDHYMCPFCKFKFLRSEIKK